METNLNEPPNNARAYDIAIVLLTIAALTFAYFGLEQRVANEWPTSNATIVQAEQEDDPDPTASGKYRDHLTVTYTYNVNGRSYQNKEVAQPLVAKPDIKNGTQSFAVGTIHEIRYNPDVPQESQLASVAPNHRHYMVIGVGLLLVAIVGLFMRKKMTQSDATDV